MKTHPLIVVLRHLIGLTLSLVFLLPVFWGLVSSFKPNAEIFAHLSPLNIRLILPFPFTLESYRQLLSDSKFMLALANTLWVAAVTVAGGIFVNAFAGFAFAVLRFPYKKLIFSLVLLSFLLPPDLLLLSTYNLVDGLGLVDTKLVLILPALANGMLIFMFTQFFRSIPRDLVASALLDGAGYLRILLKIYLPICVPALIGASLLLFLSQWEAFMWPLVVVRSPENQMLQVALSAFNEEHGTRWDLVFAASSTLALVPLFILLPLQKYYIASVTDSSLK